MAFIRIQDHDNLVRDTGSGAVINNNKVEYENYLARRKANLNMKDELKKNSDDISKIQDDLTEVKELLLTLLKQGKN